MSVFFRKIFNTWCNMLSKQPYNFSKILIQDSTVSKDTFKFSLKELIERIEPTLLGKTLANK
jgi:hypothetical protein